MQRLSALHAHVKGLGKLKAFDKAIVIVQHMGEERKEQPAIALGGLARAALS